MNKKISALPTADAITGSEIVVLNQDGVTKTASVNDMKSFKVYTALLAQSGTDTSNQFISSGDLLIGRTYQIDTADGGADWTNVGSPNNTTGTYFIATDTTPNSWGTDGGGQLVYANAAPVATVLENTLGFNIYWFYDYEGVYYGKAMLSSFRYNKTFLNVQVGYNDSPYTAYGAVFNEDNTYVVLQFLDDTGSAVNIDGEYLPLEIRVYN